MNFIYIFDFHVFLPLINQVKTKKYKTLDLVGKVLSIESSSWVRVCMGRVEGIFWPNPPWWVKKNSTQPNPTHMDRVGSGWTHGFDIFIIIIIKFSRKKYKY